MLAVHKIDSNFVSFKSQTIKNSLKSQQIIITFITLIIVTIDHFIAIKSPFVETFILIDFEDPDVIVNASFLTPCRIRVIVNGNLRTSVDSNEGFLANSKNN